ncbi:hypothetical protein HNQ10_002804 [Deinococcus metallilatus]|uniref:Uncharacterized protein n=1 Tax=Deinococcus metallilatus TaxID=1211322 RepID=A0ABR6MVJ9_9DEIO|nr:hypothetical protein [Deinococcus metallilatus]GMA14500.1 hypothetical protein GCM10025871_08310 [Deinococcus metallilatus]
MQEDRLGSALDTDERRGPPPSISTPVLLLVLMTFAGLFLVASLVFQPGHEALRFLFMALTLAPPSCMAGGCCGILAGADIFTCPCSTRWF